MNRTSSTYEGASRMASGFFLLILRMIYILEKPKKIRRIRFDASTYEPRQEIIPVRREVSPKTISVGYDPVFPW